jgi:hypothetical protein
MIGAAIAIPCQVFCGSQPRRVPCVLCQLLFIGLKPRRKVGCPTRCPPDKQWVSLCSSVQLGHGDIQGIQPLLHYSLAACHPNALPFVVAGEVVQDRAEESHGYCFPQQTHARSCNVLLCHAFLGLMAWPGARAIGCLDWRRYRSGRRSLPAQRRELTLLADEAIAARAVGGDGVCIRVFVSGNPCNARVFANARNEELQYLSPLSRCGYAGL